MNVLDSDGAALKHGNLVAARDVVQFVPFRTYAADHTALAAATLKEVPAQVLSYFRNAGIAPNPRR
jgi:hypothetical protein